MGRQEGIIYSYDLSTIPSVLPAFANAKDLIVVDEVPQNFPPNGPARIDKDCLSWKKAHSAPLGTHISTAV